MAVLRALCLLAVVSATVASLCGNVHTETECLSINAERCSWCVLCSARERCAPHRAFPCDRWEAVGWGGFSLAVPRGSCAGCFSSASANTFA
jgi:hypothetical protein